MSGEEGRKRKQKIAFVTLGCKVNQYETEAIREQFDSLKYEYVPFSEKADIYIINTCTVTARSEHKSRWIIRKVKRENPQALVVAIGCYAQAEPDELLSIPGVNLVLGNEEKPKVLEYIRKWEISKRPFIQISKIGNEYSDLSISKFKGRTRAFLKIQDGCDQFCSYCKIPYVRGSTLRSRAPEGILNEVQRLSKEGFKEFVLTGIRLGAYGKDLKRKVDLAKLIKLLETIEGVKRLRLSSIEPQDMTEELIKIIAYSSKVCRHFHIPLQSGDDQILNRMNRKYTSKEYSKLIEKIRAIIPEVAITTDVIVGFPGETERCFQRSYNFIVQMNFSRIHIFRFSKREGTLAETFKPEIETKIVKERKAQLLNLTYLQSQNFSKRFLGKELKVLIERKGKKTDFLAGFSDNYIRVLIKESDSLINQIVKVRIKKIESAYTMGDINV